MKPISKYFDIKTDPNGNDYMEVYLDGIALLRLVLSNKGTSFTEEERIALRLDGLLPPQVNTLDQQVERVYRGFKREPDPLAKYQFLRGLQERSDITGFNWADVPAILVEMGFMTNPTEDRLLATPAYQRRAAVGLCRGVLRFLRRPARACG